MFTLRHTLAALALASATTLTSLTAAPITGFDDISLWYGSGSNEAALVIDWNDGSAQDSFAWGFRWNGVATGEDMFRVIAGALAEANSPAVPGPAIPDGNGDSALALFIRVFDFASPGDPPALFPSVDRITYQEPGGPFHDQNGDGFNDGFWSYWNDEGGGDYPDSWAAGDTGFADRTLANGSWDAFSFVPGFDGVPPSAAVAAVPEPSTIFLLAGALLTLMLFIRRRHREA